MRPGTPALYDESDALGIYAEEVEQASEDDLWFLPGPMDDEPDYLPPGPRAEPRETEVLDETKGPTPSQRKPTFKTWKPSRNNA